MSLARRDSDIQRTFFDRPVDIVARDLIGRTLDVTDSAGCVRGGMIVETEAYGGPEDPASHAAFRPGGRASLMAGPPGTVYVYAAYGMYPCFNIVTGPEGKASAVLVRGVWIRGVDAATLGPGRTTRALGITLEDHGLLIPGGRFSISEHLEPLAIIATSRVGITRGTERKWRFVASHVA